MSREGYDSAGKPVEHTTVRDYQYLLFHRRKLHSTHGTLRKAQRRAETTEGRALDWTYTPPLCTWWNAGDWSIRPEWIDTTA